jgi:hypothetical protein
MNMELSGEGLRITEVSAATTTITSPASAPMHAACVERKQ